MNKVYAYKKKDPTEAYAMAQIDYIMDADNETEKYAALIELSYALRSMTVNGARPSSCYFVAPKFTVNQNEAPILYSGASTTFATSDEYLTNPRKHKTPIPGGRWV